MLLKDKVKQYRKEHGLSQQAFADKIGFTRGYISDIEVGKKVTGSMKLLKALATNTEHSFDYWADVNFEESYRSLEALDQHLDLLIENGLIDLNTGEIDPKMLEGVLKILKLEINLKIFRIKKEGKS